MPIKVASAKAKGRNLQKWVCEKISQAFNIPYDQQDDNCDIHSREMGQSGIDVILRGEAVYQFPFAIECKSTERLNLVDAIQQAKDNLKPPYKFWAVIHKRKKFKKPIIIMDFEDFLNLYI